MTTRQAVGRPTARVLLAKAAAAMSLFFRSQAVHNAARPMMLHSRSVIAASADSQSSSMTSNPCRSARNSGFISSMAFMTCLGRVQVLQMGPKSVGAGVSTRARPGSGSLRASIDGFGVRGGLVGARSRRRRRTSLGMVSDQPFKAPTAEPLESMSFRQLGLSDELVDSMDEFGFSNPSKIQRKAVPQILSGGNIVLAAETGSGKTLAYLLPIVQLLKAQEDQQDIVQVRRIQRPRALVLVPTRELAVQVLEVAKRISHVCKISSCGVVGGEDYAKQKRRLAGTVDVVIASPGRLLKHYEQGNLFLSQVTHVVIDEVDTMLTQGFSGDIEKLTRPILANPDRIGQSQFVFVTATLTRAVRKLLNEGGFPKVRMLETRDVHHSLPSLKHVMIDIKGRDKMSALIDVVRQYTKAHRRTLIFCNTVKSCRAADFGMKEVDIPALSYHGEVPSNERTKNLEKFKAGEVEYLVCTDIASRGLDMPDVEHVVMFDFPLNPIDYLHRSGRTARMGAKGMVTSILAKRDLVLAAAIEKTVQLGRPLDELSSRKTDYASGGKLGQLFGRKGVAKRKGNHHTLKREPNVRGRVRASKQGRLDWEHNKRKNSSAVGPMGRRSGSAGERRRTTTGKTGRGRARTYN